MAKMSANEIVRLALAGAMLAVLPACSTALWALPPAANTDAPRVVDTDTDYLLNPGDTVKVTVYGEDTLTGQYTLDQRGQLTVPLAGTVDVAGMTRRDAQAAIAAKLKKGRYLAKPLVTVDLVTTRPVYIVGEVKNPGAYPWQPGLDALNAVALAGGYTPRAAQNMFLIDRATGGPAKRHLNGGENTPVLPGDSITVRERIF